MDKKKQALEVTETLLTAIECATIGTHSALLQCLRIARLIGDMDSIIWLQYELGGYPRTEEGKVEKVAWNIAYNNGRGYIDGGNKLIFTSLVSELTVEIETQKLAVNNFTTNGVSVSGEKALLAMEKLTNSVSYRTSGMIKTISTAEYRLSVLRSKYYDYALKVNIELTFSNTVTGVFEKYKEMVDIKFNELTSSTIIKLQAIDENLHSDNPEMLSQVLTTCRRLFENVSKELFNKYYPDFSDKFFKTKSGKEIDVSGDHYINKLSAVIERLLDKSPNKTLIGSNIIYLVDWIENLINVQCKGVHASISKDEALRCVIHTYICLGDILKMQNSM